MRGMSLPEARCCLFERFQENLKYEPRQAIRMEKPLETTWVSPKIGRGRVSGNHQSGANSMRQVDGVSYMALPAGSVGEGELKKRTMAFASTSIWEKAAPSSHPDAGQFISSLYVSGTFQAAATMLELRRSESELVCVNPLSRTLWACTLPHGSMVMPFFTLRGASPKL